jgi:hypothetical protein
MDIEPEAIWFSLNFARDIVFGTCYIPPEDSPYYEEAHFANIQARLLNEQSKHYLIIGDLNARVGTLNELLKMSVHYHMTELQTIP